MKKFIGTICLTIFAVAAMAGCTANGGGAEGEEGNASKEITVISREEGSGTRGAFVELLGIEEKDAEGNKVDRTIDTADQTNSTGVMLQSVAQNDAAIGYVSLGSMNDTVKALEIDGAAATVENIKNGSYAISRPFNIVTGAALSDSAKDFISFILSSDGQAVIEEKGYIAVSDAAAYEGTGATEKIVVAGSSSVSPVMEKLIEAYKAIYPDAEIELQTSDSTTGVNSVVDGISDIGMASRELKDSEIGAGVTGTVIAMDGIAVIVNLENPVSAMTSEQVCGIYIGEITNWNEIA
ncbi:MAG: extracellular solute-binding protein [Clostridiaceae bacterium]|nr:extracellular solute-binding protein [Clostridiaceae bacterium]